MSEPRLRTERLVTLDRGVTTACVVLLIVASVLAPILAAVNGMRVAACRDVCRTDLIGAGAIVIALGPAATLAAVGLTLLLVRRRARWFWWIGVLGLAVALGLIVLGDAMVTAGVGG